MTALSEFELIEKLLKPLAAQAPGAFALADDAAMLPDLALGESFVVTKDALSIGTHMLADDPPADMARKALRVNLSDLAAMGARPVGFFMALCLGDKTDQAFLETFVEGLADDVAQFDIPLMGGDIIRHEGAFTVSITAFGAVQKDNVLRRNGARAGDSLWVSGTIGDGALGLKAARGELPALDPAHREALIQRYRVPEPRLNLGADLAGTARACIDISDGLIADVGHICELSGIGCSIEVEAVPLSEAGRYALNLESDILSTILTGGDDYELAFSVDPKNEKHLSTFATETEVPVKRIGRFEKSVGVRVMDGTGSSLNLKEAGYVHGAS